MTGIDTTTLPFAIPQRLYRIERDIRGGWILWIATRDYIHGTFIMLWDDGKAERVTIREDEGDEILMIRPCDMEA